MIQPVDYTSSKAVQFKAVYKIAKKNNVKGNLSYSLTKNLSSLKSAVKDILSKNKGSNLKPEVKAVLDKFEMSFDGGISLLSILGAGSLLKLYLADTKSNKDILGIDVKTDEKASGTYFVEGSNIIKKVGKKQKYLTQTEMDSIGIEKLLTSISEAADFPLLRLRQVQNPQPRPYVSQFLEEEPVRDVKKNITIEGNIQEEKIQREERVSEKSETAPVIHPRKLPSWLMDTSAEVDKLIAKLRKQAILPPTKISQEYHSIRDIGKISSRTQNLLSEILELFSQLDSIYEERGVAVLNELRNKLPSYKSYRKASTIAFENLGAESEGLTFVRSCSKKHGGKDIYAIYKRDSNGNTTDVIPICDNKIYRMQKSFSLQDTSRFINMISISKCLSQEEVDSKNLPEVLLILKNELVDAINLVDPVPGKVSDRIKNLIQEIDTQYVKLSEKENFVKKDAVALFQKLKTGGIFVRNFNNDGDNLIYINSEENRKMPGAILIKINEKGGEFKEGWLIKDGKVLRNYNGKNNYYPKEIRYFNSAELEKMHFEERALSCLEAIKSNFELSNKILNTYKSLKNTDNIKP